MDGSLLGMEDRDRVEMVLKYIEDGDLRRWSLPDVRAFNIGMSEWRSKLNCFTNPYMYEQLLEISATDVIAKGKSCVSNRQKAAKKLLDKPIKLRLGRGLYGECLGVRADGNSELSDEIGKQLSIKSAAAGLSLWSFHGLGFYVMGIFFCLSQHPLFRLQNLSVVFAKSNPTHSSRCKTKKDKSLNFTSRGNARQLTGWSPLRIMPRFRLTSDIWMRMACTLDSSPLLLYVVTSVLRKSIQNQRNLGDIEKMMESGFIIPEEIPNHSWLKRGLDAAPNRYGIKPGTLEQS